MKLIELDIPEVINSSTQVVGLDLDTNEPVLNLGTPDNWTLTQAQRPYWEEGKERFSKSELDKMEEVVKPLRKRGK